MLTPLLLAPIAGATLQPGFDQVKLGQNLGGAGNTRAWGVAIANFTSNTDPYPDIVSGGTFGDVLLYRGDGHRNFVADAAAAINGPYHDAYGVAAGDFTGDGKADLVIGKTVDGANDGCVFLYPGNGDGSFQKTGAAGSHLGTLIGDAGTNVTALASGDVDGDGDVDLVANDIAIGTTDPANIVLFRNPGTGPPYAAETIVSKLDVAIDPNVPPYYPPSSGTLAGYGLALGDVDGDTDLDLLFTDKAGYVYMYANDGAGTFSAIRFDNITSGTRPYGFVYLGFDATGIAAGDINGDGRCDFAVGLALNGETDGKVMVFLNEGTTGTGSSKKPLFSAMGVVGGAGTDSRGIAIGKLDSLDNASPDIAFGNYEGGVYGLFTDTTDADADGIIDRLDNLDTIPNFPTIDLNGDGALNQADQIDLDGDGEGTVWDDTDIAHNYLAGDPDADGDAILNGVDNLPMVPNPPTADRNGDGDIDYEDQLDEDNDGVGEVSGGWPLCTLGDVLDDRDPDGDGIPNGPFDPTLQARYREAKRKLMTGTTPIMLRIDALGRWWQAEFTQTLADSIYMDPTTFAAEYPNNYNGTYGGNDLHGHSGPGHGYSPPADLVGGKELPVSVMLIPKLLWTDSGVVSYLSNRLPREGFELGQHGTYHADIAKPSSLPASEMNGYDPLEMYVYMRVGQDTMLGNYSRPGASDYLRETAGAPKISWADASQPLFSFAPPYDEFDRSACDATARLGYGAFSSDKWVEGEARTLMPNNIDEFDEFGALHNAATFMPYGTLDEILYDNTEYADYTDYITRNLTPGKANCILIEEVNFSSKDAGGAVSNMIDAEKWANFQLMLDIVKSYPGAVPMTLGEYAMARAYDNAPEYFNPEQADADHDGLGDQPVTLIDHTYKTSTNQNLVVPAPGVLEGSSLDASFLDAVLVGGAERGRVTLDPDGSFVYMPAEGYIGPDSFTYRAVEGAFESEVRTAYIDVKSTPVALDDTYSVYAGQTLTVDAPGFLANDTDPDPVDSFTMVEVDFSATANCLGVVNLSGSVMGSFSILPDAGYTGPVIFDYRVLDSHGEWSNWATVTVDVLPTTPTAVDDTYSVYAGQQLSVDAPGFLISDTDPDPADSFTMVEVDFSATANCVGVVNLSGSVMGSFSILPDAGYTGPVIFDYRVLDSHGEWSNWATVTIDVLPTTPTAVDDTASTLEDTPVTIDVIANDTDADLDELTAAKVSDPANGTAELNADGNFVYKPNDNWFGVDTFTCKAVDTHGNESDPATVEVTVTSVNDPPSVSIEPAEQIVQYSDPTAEAEASFGDADGPDYSGASHTAFPADIAPTAMISNISPLPWYPDWNRGGGRTWFGGIMAEPKGDYPVTFTISDTIEERSATTTYHVLPEDATIDSLDNPGVIPVTSAGGSGTFTLTGSISQADDGYPGDLSKAAVNIKLIPVGPGSTIEKTVTSDASGHFSAAFAGVPVNCYEIVAHVNELGYFTSPMFYDVITVYDPSMKSATGGGWFYWPGTQDRTNFGFVTSYGKRGTSFKGSLVMVRRTENGNYRLKSNALTGLVMGEISDPVAPYGWCSFSGKATYMEPGWPDALGNYSFSMYAEDRNEPGTGIDKFWIRVKDRNGAVTVPVSMSEPAKDMATPINGGNIAIPHKVRVK